MHMCIDLTIVQMPCIIIHCKNVRVISTLPGFAQLHLFRGILDHMLHPYTSVKFKEQLAICNVARLPLRGISNMSTQHSIFLCF